MKKIIALLGMIIVALMTPYHAMMQEIDEIRDQPLLSSTIYGEWSIDSQWFTYVDEMAIGYSDIKPTVEGPGWIAYQPSTGRYIADTTWHSQPTLTPEEISIFNTNDLIRTSPDGEILLFSVLTPKGYQYNIANRTTKQVVTLEIYYVEEVNYGFLGPVFWSDDGNSLVLTHAPSPYAPVPIHWYIHIPDRNDLNSVTLTEFPVEIGPYSFISDDFTQDKLFDMDSTGTRLLIGSRDITVEPVVYRLVVWYPNNLEESYVIEGFNPREISSMAFSPLSEDQIVIMYKSGEVTLYDLLTQEEYHLKTINEMYWSSFSPDGNWLVFNQRHRMYFTEIEPLLQTAMEPSNKNIPASQTGLTSPPNRP